MKIRLPALPATLPPLPVLLPMSGCALLALLGLALGWQAWHADRALAGDAPAAMAAPGAAAATAATATTAQPALDALAQSRLFGDVADAPPAAQAADAKPKPDTSADGQAPDALPNANIGLTLQGIVFREQADARRALIRGGNTPNIQARAYRLGQTITDGVVVRFIEPRRVVVDVRGELQALALPNPQGLPGAPGTMDGMPLPEAMPVQAAEPDAGNP